MVVHLVNSYSDYLWIDSKNRSYINSIVPEYALIDMNSIIQQEIIVVIYGVMILFYSFIQLQLHQYPFPLHQRKLGGWFHVFGHADLASAEGGVVMWCWHVAFGWDVTSGKLT